MFSQLWNWTSGFHLMGRLLGRRWVPWEQAAEAICLGMKTPIFSVQSQPGPQRHYQGSQGYPEKPSLEKQRKKKEREKKVREREKKLSLSGLLLLLFSPPGRLAKFFPEVAFGIGLVSLGRHTGYLEMPLAGL